MGVFLWGRFPYNPIVRLFYTSPVDFLQIHYRGASLTKKRTPLGPYSRPMPRAVRGSKGGRRFLMSEVPL